MPPVKQRNSDTMITKTTTTTSMNDVTDSEFGKTAVSSAFDAIVEFKVGVGAVVVVVVVVQSQSLKGTSLQNMNGV